ncbi:hypothetical protein GQ53DRAFT_444503 [Thozetella sp. PMI_491]|nr:hypothetical protein GQ53DRAFT_444503 [Thozetella sp. PMI_491]
MALDVTDISPLIKQLDGNLDELQAAIKPLLGNLEDVSSKLPLLDRAKLHVMVAYAIESVLFSTLQLNGGDARQHAVFTEITRIRQYFEKIKKAETPAPQRETGLNTQAAMRFIRSDLSDNKEISAKLKEEIAKAEQAAEQAKAELAAAQARKRDSDALDDSDSEHRPGDAQPRKKKKNSKGSKKEKKKSR